MKNRRNRRKDLKLFSILIDIIILIIAYLIISKLWHIYKLNDFGDFIKAEYVLSNVSEFIRDDDIKYSDISSYKITSYDFNDAVIYKNIEVEKETSYKVSVMAKYENVENEDQNAEAGVNIGIMDTIEKSESYIGTSDGWQKITFEFNSKNRESIDIAFRLGAYDSNAKGTVWFSDFQIEKGNETTDNNWNCALFIMNNIEVNIEKNGVSKLVKTSLNKSEIQLLKENIERFKNVMPELSGNMMTITYKIYNIDTPITSISYSDEQGYYITSADVKNLIDDIVNENEFDHIFVAYKLGEELHEEHITSGGDWIGLRWDVIW